MWWPQITFVILASINVGWGIGKHGQSRQWNAYLIIADVIFTSWLLWIGGFFDPLFSQ